MSFFSRCATTNQFAPAHEGSPEILSNPAGNSPLKICAKYSSSSSHFLAAVSMIRRHFYLENNHCMLQPNPCGEGAECTPGNDRSGSDRPVCLCPSGSRGNPLQRCTKGNYTPKASPMHLFGPYYFYCQLQASVLMMATVAPTGLATTSSVLTLAMMLVELRPSAR